MRRQWYILAEESLHLIDLPLASLESGRIVPLNAPFLSYEGISDFLRRSMVKKVG
jgi:hypothetical protein